MATQIIKWGPSQLTKKTPDIGHWVPQFYLLFSACGMGMLSSLGIPHDVLVKIAVIAIAWSPFFVLVGQMFGISLPAQEGTEQVPGSVASPESIPV